MSSLSHVNVNFGMKRRRQEDDPSMVPPSMRRRTGMSTITVPNKNPILHGITNPAQEQVEVTINAFLNRALYNSNSANMNGNMRKVIPGTLTDQDKIFDLRPGDPTFSIKRDLAMTGSDNPRVITAFNGLSHSMYKTSHHMRGQFRFMGFSLTNQSFNSTATSRVPITLQPSVWRTVVNNGDQDLKAGDIVAYTLPYFNKYSDNAIEKHIDMSWVMKNSGHSKTTRIVPKLTKVTPSFITDIQREYFVRLMSNSETNRMMMYFPTDRFIIPQKNLRSEFLVDDIDPIGKAAIGKYNDIILGSFAVIRTLIEKGILNGVSNMIPEPLRPGAHIEPNELIQRKNAYTSLMDEIAYFTGFCTSDIMKRNEDQDMTMKRKDCVQDILTHYYYPFCNRKTKDVFNMKMRMYGIGPKLQELFRVGCKVGIEFQNATILDRMECVVGVITRGGKTGKTVNGDFGRPKFLV